MYFRHYDQSMPLGPLNAKLDPRSFLEAATHAPDQGTANELQYIAELITQYNADGDVNVLHEAYALLSEVLPHMLKE